MPDTTLQPLSEATPHLATTDVRFRRLLLAIDFSPQTKSVIHAAIAIAKCFNSELFLVNAATPMIYSAGAEFTPVDTLDVELEIAEARMQQLLAETPSLSAVKHHEIVAYAKPMDLIHQVVKEERINLVIAGSHGAARLERLAMGSVAEGILRSVPCPVIIIGPRAVVSANPFASIVFAASLDPAALRSAQYASALAEHFHSTLTLVHAIEPNSRHRIVQPELMEDRTLRDLERLLPPGFPAVATATTLIEYGRAGEVIPNVARSKGATAIVTGCHQKSSLADHAPWSTLAQIVRNAPCPVFSVRDHLI